MDSRRALSFLGTRRWRWTPILLVLSFIALFVYTHRAPIYNTDTNTNNRPPVTPPPPVIVPSSPTKPTSSRNNDASTWQQRRQRPAPLSPDDRPSLAVLVTTAMFSAHSIDRLLGSIDHPIDRIVITWNGGQEDVGDVLDKWRDKMPQLEIHHHPVQIGCAGGWNAGILATFNSSYWFVANDDIHFAPGALADIAWEAEQSLSNPDHDKAVSLHPEVDNWKGESGMVGFIVYRRGLQRIGLFDENIFPAYHEDTDYGYRIVRAGMTRMTLGRGPNKLGAIIHGEDKGTYRGGMDSKQDQIEAKNARRMLNCAHPQRYFAAKWGAVAPSGGGNTAIKEYDTPFDDPQWPMDSWVFDAARRKCILEAKDGCDCDYKVNRWDVLARTQSNQLYISNPFRTVGVPPVLHRPNPRPVSPIRFPVIHPHRLPCHDITFTGLHHVSIRMRDHSGRRVDVTRRLFCLIDDTIAYSHQPARPWTLFLKLSSGSGWNVRGAFQGCQDCSWKGAEQLPDHDTDDRVQVSLLWSPHEIARETYRSDLFYLPWQRSFEVMIAVYANGTRVGWVIFDAPDGLQPLNWWKHDRILASSWKNLHPASSRNTTWNGNFNFFGDTYGNDQYDLIMNSSPPPSPSWTIDGNRANSNDGCKDGIGHSSGWLIRRLGNCGNDNARWAQLWYSATNGDASLWDPTSTTKMAMADTFVIYVR